MFWIKMGSILMALAVTLGAFGAHGLRSQLTPEAMMTFKTAVLYQFIHALGILLIGILSLQMKTPLLDYSGWCFLAGIILFSGSLYVLAVNPIKLIGILTPLGGLLFISGWVILCFIKS